MKSYAVADFDGREEEFLQRVATLFERGVDFLQLRAHRMLDNDLLGLARRVAALPRTRTKFLVNGRCDIAQIVGADGVHLPAAGIPADAVRSISRGLMIGRSCHSVSDVHAAVGEHCDYVVLGPVFDTRSKVSAAGITREELRDASEMDVDVFALGGVSRENMATLKGIGLAGIAAITLFMRDEPISDILEEVRQL